MGFGLIFVGYILTFLIGQGNFGAFAQPIGEIVIIYSMFLLKDYNRNFKYCIYPLIPMTALSLYSVIATLDEIFLWKLGFVTPTAISVVSTAYLTLSLGFSAMMLMSLRSIAIETGVEKIPGNAISAAVSSCIYFVLCILGYMPFMESVKKYLVPFGLLFWLLSALLALLTIFRCYRYICSEDDADMKRKKSGIKFIDDLNEKFDEKEERARKADADYRLERMNKKYDKFKSRVDAAASKSKKNKK